MHHAGLSEVFNALLRACASRGPSRARPATKGYLLRPRNNCRNRNGLSPESQGTCQQLGRRAKPNSVGVSAASASIAMTAAAGGPRRHAARNAAIAAPGPHTSASTSSRPRFLTQPATPVPARLAHHPVAIADPLHPTVDPPRFRDRGHASPSSTKRRTVARSAASRSRCAPPGLGLAPLLGLPLRLEGRHRRRVRRPDPAREKGQSQHQAPQRRHGGEQHCQRARVATLQRRAQGAGDLVRLRRPASPPRSPGRRHRSPARPSRGRAARPPAADAPAAWAWRGAR